MVAGGAFGGGVGQSQGVPAICAESDRLIPSGLALLLALASPWYTLAWARQGLPQLLGVETGGVLLLGLALGIRRPRVVPLAIILLAVPEALVLAERGPLLLAPLLGAGLLAASELSYWSLQLAQPGRSTARLRAVLSWRLVLLAVAGSGMGWLVLSVAGLPAAGTIDLTLLGVVAVVGILGLAAWLVRSAVRAEPPP
ncbi:MAG: hypothetical protein ACYCZN_03430 [Candidatus Dormibacteria bacterium]